MEEKNTINQSRPITYAEAVQQTNWGGDKRCYKLAEGTDQYLAGTAAQPEDQTQPEDSSGATINLADIALLRDMFASRSRVL